MGSFRHSPDRRLLDVVWNQPLFTVFGEIVHVYPSEPLRVLNCGPACRVGDVRDEFGGAEEAVRILQFGGEPEKSQNIELINPVVIRKVGTACIDRSPHCRTWP